ncbi:MAG: D-2-hydroxyacid dehydrogenase [Gammaproteobacteria bacterium]|nr:D-2-hydroxyacid dehydrogenase [Gammaproteobacteria bacterium]
MKAVFLDYATMGPGLDLQPLRALFPDIAIHDDTPDAQVAERIRDAEFVFTNKIRLSVDLLADARKLRYIGLTATGTDNIDLATATAHGIAVCNIRGYCTQSVVEHVFGTLLLLTHSLARFHASVKAGEWQRSGDFCLLSHPVRELSSMTMGIVGYGELGQGVARIARQFGMQVIVSTRPGAADVADDRVSFDAVLRRADVISLHCPLNERTRGLFDADAFAKMKSGAILINTARGALVDSQALVDALTSGHLGGASIDVLAKEPPLHGDPILDYAGDNLIVTPHIAWATDEARQNAVDELAANVAAFLRGESRNRVV